MRITRLPLLALLALVFGSLSAQNWHPFPGDWEYVFAVSPSPTNPEGLTVIGRDSLVLEGSDWVTYLNRVSQVALEDSTCDVSSGPPTALSFLSKRDNRMGGKVISRLGGVYLFVFETGDTFRLETQIPLLTTFDFNADSGITATLSNMSVGTVGAGLDSLLTYMLSNGREIQLSKRHGIVKGYDFLSLPEWEGLGGPVQRNMLLRGLDSLPGQESHPEFDDAFNFDVGDHFQYRVHYVGGSGEYWEWKDYEVLTKTVNSDSSLFTYDMTEAKKKYFFTGGVWDTTYYPSAPIVATFSAFDFKGLDSLLPGEENAEWMYLDGIHKMPDFNNRYGMVFQEKAALAYDTCSNGYWHVEGSEYRAYGVGLGLVKHVRVDVGGLLIEELLCYTKATDSAGTCEDVTIGVPDRAAAWLLQVYPNPATDVLVVDVPAQVGQVAWQMVDALGREVLHGHAANQWRVDVSGLSSGLYLFRASTASGEAVVRRVRIE